MIELYTDGACSHNSTWQGGWGYALVRSNEMFHSDSAVVDKTTNNRMELQAVIEGLQAIQGDLKREQSEPIVVLSDSAYVVNCFLNKWYVKWEKNGWRNAQKKPVENRELWEKLLTLVRSFSQITFKKVKGHDGNHWNELVDQLATKDIANR